MAPKSAITRPRRRRSPRSRARRSNGRAAREGLMMRSASAALFGVALALLACQPADESVVPARADTEVPQQVAPRGNEAVADTEVVTETPETVAAPIARTFVFDCDGGYSFTV